MEVLNMDAEVVMDKLNDYYDSLKPSTGGGGLPSGNTDLSKFVQKSDLANYAKASDLNNYATKEAIKDELNEYVMRSELQQGYATKRDIENVAKVSDIPDVTGFVTNAAAIQIVEDYIASHNIKGDISEEDVTNIVSEYINSLNIKDGQDGYTPVRGTDYMNEDDITAINSTISSSVAEYVEEHKSELKGERGKDGQSIKGDKGVDGKSAYETWISLGNSGTEEDFINSLKGAKGDSIKGDKGDSVKGDKGDTGLSAYELWLEQGHEGTLEDFFEAYRGHDGNVGEIDMSSYAKKQDLPNMENYVQDEELDDALKEYAKATDIPTVPTTDIDFDDAKWTEEVN